MQINDILTKTRSISIHFKKFHNVSIFHALDKTFNKINGVSSHINQEGFIAHELAAVLPLAVIGSKDAMKLNEQGDTVPDYQTINRETLIPYLVSAIQEQQTQIEELKKEIQEMKSNG